jgi:hypothetical protein
VRFHEVSKVIVNSTPASGSLIEARRMVAAANVTNKILVSLFMDVYNKSCHTIHRMPTKTFVSGIQMLKNCLNQAMRCVNAKIAITADDMIVE